MTPGRRPGLLGTILVVGTLALAGALAWQAVRAAASHRAAVEATLQHHATTAAWRYAREARGWVGYGMNEAANALEQEVARRPALQGPELLQRVLAQKYCDCMTAAFASTVLRFVPGPDAALDLLGEPLSERAQDALRDRMRAIAADPMPRQDSRRWQILPPGTPRLNRAADVALLWRIAGREGKARAVYGMIVEPAQLARPLQGALEGAQFFPPQLVPLKAADSLVRLEVAGPNGVPVFASGPPTHRFAGTDTLGAAYGDLVVLAAINPAAAQVLIAGGLPASRAPTIVALLVLALALGLAAALLRRREQKLARLREDFVSGVSHELRTPMTQIRMLSELLETDGFKSPAERSRAIAVIHRESLRLSNLVDNILEFSRLRRGNGAVAPGSVELRAMLHETVETLRPLLEAQGSRLELVASEPIEIGGDRDAVSRVVRNLVENAAKYGPPAQTIRVTLSRIPGSRGARITVDDDGPGIPPEEHGRIFQPYYRLERDRNAPAGGSGLGLSVVADLVRLLGGSVSVGAAPAGGARFTVLLPDAAE
jgi:signal transduction histidine kinase